MLARAERGHALAWAILFVVGATCGALFGYEPQLEAGALPARPHAAPPAPPAIETHRRESHPLVRPMLACEPGREETVALAPVRAALAQGLAKQRVEGRITHGSVYLRDLTSGGWLSIDGDDLFAPASLNKVLWLIIALAREARAPGTMDIVVDTPAELRGNEHQFFAPKQTLEPNHPYPLWRYVEVMVVDSDNDALNTVMGVLGLEFGDLVLKDLGVSTAAVRGRRSADPRDVISPRTVGRVFQILYDASYLSPDASDRALRLLTRSTFRLGLVAGVPEDVPVAHKFGQWTTDAPDDNEQLHDCGIVLQPRRPYVICVMTRGHNPLEQAKAIADLSARAYQAMLSTASATAQAQPR